MERIRLPDRSALTQRFATWAERLTETLDQDTVGSEAAEILSRLIERVTIYCSEPAGAQPDPVASISDLAP